MSSAAVGYFYGFNLFEAGTTASAAYALKPALYSCYNSYCNYSKGNCAKGFSAHFKTSFQAVSGKLGPGQATHLAMLRAIEGPCAPAVWPADGPRCAGLAVLHQGWAGLFDVATAPDARRQGLARTLCEQLLHWAAAQGAHHAYLQVVQANAGARALYARLGFVTAYRYWYRVKSA